MKLFIIKLFDYTQVCSAAYVLVTTTLVSARLTAYAVRQH